MASNPIPVPDCPLPSRRDLWSVYDWVQWAEAAGLPVPPARLDEIPAIHRPQARRIIDRRAHQRAQETA